VALLVVYARVRAANGVLASPRRPGPAFSATIAMFANPIGRCTPLVGYKASPAAGILYSEVTGGDCEMSVGLPASDRRRLTIAYSKPTVTVRFSYEQR